MKPTLSRKDIALAMGVHVNTVKINERRYGLHEARANTGTMRVAYKRDAAIAQLRRRGLVV